MARLGVTYQDIANAANHLLGQGKQPTIELIRHYLGTGSSTTIANHLRLWRAEQDGYLSMSRKENLPQELVTLMVLIIGTPKSCTKSIKLLNNKR